MRIAKIFVSGEHKDAKFFEVVKVGSVKFDPRPDWVLVRDSAKVFSSELFWVHPSEVRFDWVREFA